MGGETAAERGGLGLRMPDLGCGSEPPALGEALLGPSEAPLLILLEHPQLIAGGPGLCLLLLPVVVILP